MKLNVLELPKRMAQLISKDQWPPPMDLANVPFLRSLLTFPTFFIRSAERIEDETAGNRDHVAGGDAEIYGLTDQLESAAEGYLSIDHAIMIAGNYNEEFLALDYSLDTGEPRVVVSLLTDETIRWVEIAPNFESFLEMVTHFSP